MRKLSISAISIGGLILVVACNSPAQPQDAATTSDGVGDQPVVDGLSPDARADSLAPDGKAESVLDSGSPTPPCREIVSTVPLVLESGYCAVARLKLPADGAGLWAFATQHLWRFSFNEPSNRFEVVGYATDLAKDSVGAARLLHHFPATDIDRTPMPRFFVVDHSGPMAVGYWGFSDTPKKDGGLPDVRTGGSGGPAFPNQSWTRFLDSGKELAGSGFHAARLTTSSLLVAASNLYLVDETAGRQLLGEGIGSAVFLGSKVLLLRNPLLIIGGPPEPKLRAFTRKEFEIAIASNEQLDPANADIIREGGLGYPSPAERYELLEDDLLMLRGGWRKDDTYSYQAVRIPLKVTADKVAADAELPIFRIDSGQTVVGQLLVRGKLFAVIIQTLAQDAELLILRAR